MFGSNEPFFRLSNPASVAESLLGGNRDHLLAGVRSEVMKQEYRAESFNTLASVNFSGKLILSGWNWSMPITDMKNLEELVLKEKALRDTQTR